MEENNWHRKIQGTGGENILPHAMHGNSDNGVSTITSALRKAIQANVWAQAFFYLPSMGDRLNPCHCLIGHDNMTIVILGRS
jgi:hypothetical protein